MGEKNALNLRWCFGFNKESNDGTLIDLTSDGRQAIFYAVGHTGIIFDYEVRRQRLLQGHTNSITCATASDDKHWLVTGDAGEKDTMVIIWNSRTGVPVRTLFDAHPGGILCVDMTHDAVYIATVGAGPQQALSVWEWTLDSDAPIHTEPITSRDIQHCVRFNPDNPKEIVTNGPARTIFWSWEEEKLKYYSPAISSKEFATPVGRFTRSAFLPGSTQAVTGTEDGDVLLWDQVLLPTLHARATDRCGIKLLRLHEGHAVTVVTIFDTFLVTAGSEGFVRFYDLKFRLLAWYEDLDMGPICALSFTSPRAPRADGSVVHTEVRVPNFVVASSTGRIGLVNAAVFELYNKEDRRAELIVQSFETPVTAIVTHPSAPHLYIVTAGGALRVLDYESQVPPHPPLPHLYLSESVCLAGVVAAQIGGQAIPRVSGHLPQWPRARGGLQGRVTPGCVRGGPRASAAQLPHGRRRADPPCLRPRRPAHGVC